MRWKTTLLLLVVTVGLGAYLSLYELRQPSPEERQQQAKQLIDVEADAISSLALELPQAKLTLTKVADNWTLAPSGARADPARIGQLLNQLLPLSAERVLIGTTAKPLDLKAFGLAPAAGSLTIIARGKPLTLLFGDTTPVQDNRYAKLADRPDVFIIRSAVYSAVDRPAEEFRDRLFIRFGGQVINGFSVSADATAYMLARSERGWRLARPFQDLADRSEINGLLHTLSAVVIRRFIDDAPQAERVSALGFDHPKAEVEIKHEEGAPPLRLFFGRALPDDHSLVYAKRSDERPVYAVSAADVDQLLKSPEGLRAKGCFEFFTNTVARLEIARGDAKLQVERVNGQWRAAGASTALEAQRVEGLLSQLSDLRVSGFVETPLADPAQYGFQAPTGSIAVWTLNVEQPQRLVIGKAIGKTTERYGRIEGRPLVAKLPDTILKLLATDLAQLATTKTLAPPPVSTPPAPPSASRERAGPVERPGR